MENQKSSLYTDVLDVFKRIICFLETLNMKKHVFIHDTFLSNVKKN